jgi:hypothetical protein
MAMALETRWWKDQHQRRNLRGWPSKERVWFRRWVALDRLLLSRPSWRQAFLTEGQGGENMLSVIVRLRCVIEFDTLNFALRHFLYML